MRTEDFAYQLPEDRITLWPRPRGSSRLLVLDRRSGRLEESNVRTLPTWLVPGDLLLLNDVKVVPARLWGKRAGGGRCEFLLLRPSQTGWEVLARPAAKLRPGTVVRFSWGEGEVREHLGEGRIQMVFRPPLTLELLSSIGEVPLPPYIAKKRSPLPEDRVTYQTVYARAGQAVAAPTAGLHLTTELLHACQLRGVQVVMLTLDVGPGTFKPITAQDPSQHYLEPEGYEISPQAAAALNNALQQNRRIVCVGTTAVRALEDALTKGRGRVRAGKALADTFILPGFRFRGTGALLTNFHLPRSTLLMLVAAFAGKDQVLAAYEQAKALGFGFYSYGDAMLIR